MEVLLSLILDWNYLGQCDALNVLKWASIKLLCQKGNMIIHKMIIIVIYLETIKVLCSKDDIIMVKCVSVLTRITWYNIMLENFVCFTLNRNMIFLQISSTKSINSCLIIALFTSFSKYIGIEQWLSLLRYNYTWGIWYMKHPIHFETDIGIIQRIPWYYDFV